MRPRSSVITKPYNDLHMTGSMWSKVPPLLVDLRSCIQTNDVYEEDVAYKVRHPRVSEYGDPFIHVVKWVFEDEAWASPLTSFYVEDGNTRVEAARRRGDEYIVARVLELA